MLSANSRVNSSHSISGRFGILFSGFPFVHDADQFFVSEQAIRNASFHRGRASDRLVNPDEVVPDRVQRDHVTMVLEPK